MYYFDDADKIENVSKLCLLHVPVNRGTKEKGLAGEHFIDTIIQNVT